LRQSNLLELSGAEKEEDIYEEDMEYIPTNSIGSADAEDIAFLKRIDDIVW